MSFWIPLLRMQESCPLFVGLENVHMCICGYCKYHNELCYKALVCGMVVIWSCCHDALLLSKSFII